MLLLTFLFMKIDLHSIRNMTVPDQKTILSNIAEWIMSRDDYNPACRLAVFGDRYIEFMPKKLDPVSITLPWTKGEDGQPEQHTYGNTIELISSIKILHDVAKQHGAQLDQELDYESVLNQQELDYFHMLIGRVPISLEIFTGVFDYKYAYKYVGGEIEVVPIDSLNK